MAIVLYGKDGARQVIKGHIDFEAFEKKGWYRNPDMIPSDEPEIEVTEDESTKDDKLSSDDIRLMAEEAGIDGWDTKRIKTLKKELNLG
jgi:hypothetical protein